ncbi:Cyclic GMP-AMP synthase [Stylophora pistillata]|uniref:Cyclic GMP-AMP synthase n=1 Tax=Stylophora pistillata TaxID=50429 RepID=A0A2B4R8M8_STYPI|nr:Cyclic GMP-AMP synthase [Stylophora pistillata]
MRLNHLGGIVTVRENAEFDGNHVEVKEIEERITSWVKEMSNYIGRKNPLFKNTVIPSGSYFEDLKAEGPDEFDFMICLDDLSEPGVCVIKEIPLRPVPDPGYVHVQIDSEVVRQRYRRYISKRGNLKPDALLKSSRDLIEKAIKYRRRRPIEKIAESVRVELRKIPVTIKLRWKGTVYPNYEISLDLTLCIKGSGWPNASDIRRRVGRGHPGYGYFKEARKGGYHLVASTIGESGRHRPCWRLSFSVAEGIVLKSIFKNPRLIHKATLKVLKVLRKKHEHCLRLFEASDGSYRIQWAFHSYVLKTMFLHEWCEFPEDSFWGRDQLQSRVKDNLTRIERSLKDRDIRSFWVPDYKLFNFRARNPTETQSCEENLSRLIEILTISQPLNQINV